MKIAANCKVCAKPLVLTIDDDYATVGDPLKLTGMATCNRCYDYKTRKDKLTDQIGSACTMLVQLRWKKRRNSSEMESGIRENLVELTKVYAQLVQQYHHYPTILWDEAMAAILMEFPLKYWKILADYRIQCRTHARQSRVVVDA